MEMAKLPVLLLPNITEATCPTLSHVLSCSTRVNPPLKVVPSN